jgi:hypothetical protein
METATTLSHDWHALVALTFNISQEQARQLLHETNYQCRHIPIYEFGAYARLLVPMYGSRPRVILSMTARLARMGIVACGDAGLAGLCSAFGQVRSRDALRLVVETDTRPTVAWQEWARTTDVIVREYSLSEASGLSEALSLTSLGLVSQDVERFGSLLARFGVPRHVGNLERFAAFGVEPDYLEECGQMLLAAGFDTSRASLVDVVVSCRRAHVDLQELNSGLVNLKPFGWSGHDRVLLVAWLAVHAGGGAKPRSLTVKSLRTKIAAARYRHALRDAVGWFQPVQLDAERADFDDAWLGMWPEPAAKKNLALESRTGVAA